MTSGQASIIGLEFRLVPQTMSVHIEFSFLPPISNKRNFLSLKDETMIKLPKARLMSYRPASIENCRCQYLLSLNTKPTIWC